MPSLTILCWRTLSGITKHPEDGPGIAQIDKTTDKLRLITFLVRKRFRFGMNIARRRSFPGADIGSDNDLLMMTFHLRLKRISRPKYTRLKFDLEKLKNPNVLETFQGMTGGKFAPLTIMNYEDANMDSMITTFNTAVTETASEIFGKHRQKKKSWVTEDIF